jgi:hypothetical protein
VITRTMVDLDALAPGASGAPSITVDSSSTS